MPNITEATNGYVPSPRTDPNLFKVIHSNVIVGPSSAVRAMPESWFWSLKLSEECRVVAMISHDSSFWIQTAHLETVSKDEKSTSCFRKVALDEEGRRMMHGVFESMTALYEIIPDFVHKPHA